MKCEAHDWRETGVKRKHIEGPLFERDGRVSPIVTYVRCTACAQNGYRKPNSRVVYTWSN